MFQKEKEKKDKSVLGVIDSKLAASISEELEISCMHTGIVPEVLRGLFNEFSVINFC